MEAYITDKAIASGLPLPLRPATEPTMPQDLTSIHSKELVSRMQHFSELMAYAGSEAAKAGAVYAAKRAKYKFEYAKKYIQFQFAAEKKIAAKTVEYQLDCDSNLDEIKRAEVAAEQYKSLVDALFEGYNAKFNVLSRELTRRGMKGSEF